MAKQQWTMLGEYMESCNCDYLCPCVYTNPQGPVTYDHCTAALVFRIDAGSYGETKLDGLSFALVIRSGKVMADGNWVFAGVVDERADDAQRQALAAMVGGEAGGPPGFIRDNLVGDFRGIAFKPIEFNLDGLKRSTVIGDAVSFEIEGVTPRNRPTGAWRWPGQRRLTYTALVSTWISSAKATTVISRALRGPPERSRA